MNRPDKCRPPPGNPFYVSIYQAYEDGIQPSTEEAAAFEEAARKKRLQLATRAGVETSRRCLPILEDYPLEDCLVVSSGLKLRSPVPPRPAPRSLLITTPAPPQQAPRCVPPADPRPSQVAVARGLTKRRNIEQVDAAASAAAARPHCFPNLELRQPASLDSEPATSPASPTGLTWATHHPTSCSPTSPPPTGTLWHCGDWSPLRPTFEETIDGITQRRLPGDGSDLFGLGFWLRRQFCWRFYLAEAPLDGSWQRFAELALIGVDHSELSVVDAFATRYACPATEVVLYHWQHVWQTGHRDMCRYPPSLNSLHNILRRIGRFDLIELLSSGQ